MTHRLPDSDRAVRATIGGVAGSNVAPVELEWTDPRTGETLRLELSGPVEFLDRLLTSNLWTSGSSVPGRLANGVLAGSEDALDASEDTAGGSLVRSGADRLPGELRTGSTFPFAERRQETRAEDHSLGDPPGPAWPMGAA